MTRSLSETLFSHHFAILPRNKVKLLESLSESPLILQTLANSDLPTFSRSLGRKMYGLEDYLADNGNLHLQFKRGTPPTLIIRDDTTHEVLWESKDDVLGTVTNWVGFQYKQKLPEARSYDLILDRANFDLSLAADCIDLEAIESVVLPYAKTNRESYYTAINDSFLAIKELPKPGYCPRNQNHLWGRFCNALSLLYRQFRIETEPFFLEFAPKKLPTGARISKVTTLGSWEDKSVVVEPLTGLEFQPFESQLILALRPKAVVQTIDGKQYAFAGEYDPFAAIGSSWFMLPEVPDFKERPTVVSALPEASAYVQAPPPSKGECALTTLEGASYRKDIEDYVRRFVVTPLNISDKGTVGKRGISNLKLGVPHNAPEGAVNPLFGPDGKSGRVSQAKQKTIASVLPSQATHFWDIVKEILRQTSLDDTEEHERYAGWWLATKLVLMRTQAKTIMDGGRVLVRSAD